MTKLPQSDIETVRPFIFSEVQVTRIALILSGYILFGLYPAYGLLRGWWMGDFAAFTVEGCGVAVGTAAAFGVFARWTMLKYLKIET